MPKWNERFIFRAAGAVYFRFDLCIEHVVRNRTLCGHCAFSAEDLWSRAKDGRQLLTVPIVHNKGGGWEIEEELVGALRLVVGLMTLDTVEKLPQLDKKPHKLNPEHAHHHGYKGGKKPKKPKEEKYEMPTIEYVRQHLPPPLVYQAPVPMQSMIMMPAPMQSMTQIPSPIPMQSMSALPPPYSVPSPIQQPVMSVPNLVPTTLAPISNNTQSGYLMGLGPDQF